MSRDRIDGIKFRYYPDTDSLSKQGAGDEWRLPMMARQKTTSSDGARNHVVEPLGFPSMSVSYRPRVPALSADPLILGPTVAVAELSAQKLTRTPSENSLSIRKGGSNEDWTVCETLPIRFSWRPSYTCSSLRLTRGV